MRFTKLALLLGALILPACQNQPNPAAVTGAPSVGLARGIDLPTDASDVVGELQGRPWLQFVARYYRDPSSRWPALTPSEARRLAALGVKIVTVWEWHSADPAYFTYATGYNDALSASRQARSVGQPPGSAIYFAVDFNARGAALYQVDQYFRGVGAGLAAAGGGRPPYKVGVYGSGAVCGAVRGAGLAQYAWLSGSTAWEGSADYNAWNIRQAAQGARFAALSFNHDANEARNDYGGFQLGQSAEAGEVIAAAAAAPAATAALVNEAVTAMVPRAAASPVPAAPPPAPAAPLVAAAPRAAPVAAPPQIALAAPATTTPAPVPAPVQLARVTPAAPSNTAAEVAALAAAEPEARSSAHAAANKESPRDRASPRAAKEAVAGKKAVAVAVNSRAVAAPLHRQGASSPTALQHGETREPAHKTSTARRADEHAAHPQAAKAGAVAASDRPAHHGVEQRHPEHAHRAHEIPG